MIRRLTPGILSCLLIPWFAVSALAADSEQPRKAAFLEDQELAFIRPGLVFTIEQAWVDVGGTVKYRFSVTDPKGAPLDLNGVFTPGSISIRSIVAYIPDGDTLYRSYNARQTTSPGGGSAEQATTDSGGSFQTIGAGVYVDLSYFAEKKHLRTFFTKIVKSIYHNFFRFYSGQKYTYFIFRRYKVSGSLKYRMYCIK